MFCNVAGILGTQQQTSECMRTWSSFGWRRYIFNASQENRVTLNVVLLIILKSSTMAHFFIGPYLRMDDAST